MRVPVTDLPYLEPLLFWLRDDPTLKNEFTQKSFFMPHMDLVDATREAMDKKCPAPRALWVLPGDTLAIQSRPGCKSQGNHTFYIQIIVQCIRGAFELTKVDDEVHLAGQAMSLFEIRRLVKASVLAFYKDYEAKGKKTGGTFSDLQWQRDQILYPQSDEGNNFLSTAIQYQVKID